MTQVAIIQERDSLDFVGLCRTEAERLMLMLMLDEVQPENTSIGHDEVSVMAMQRYKDRLLLELQVKSTAATK